MPEINLRCVKRSSGYGFTFDKLYASAWVNVDNGEVKTMSVVDDNGKHRIAKCIIDADKTLKAHGYHFSVRPIPGVPLD